MFGKNKPAKEPQKDPIDLEVQAIMGPPPGEQASSIIEEDQADQGTPKETPEPSIQETVKNLSEKITEPKFENNASEVSAPIPPLTDDTETKKAIKDIIAKESDELLAAKDQNLKQQTKPVKKKSRATSIIFVLVAIIFGLLLISLLVPSSREYILKPF